MIRCKRAPFVVQSLLVLIGKKQKDKPKQNQNMKPTREGRRGERRGGDVRSKRMMGKSLLSSIVSTKSNGLRSA